MTRLRKHPETDQGTGRNIEVVKRSRNPRHHRTPCHVYTKGGLLLFDNSINCYLTPITLCFWYKLDRLSGEEVFPETNTQIRYKSKYRMFPPSLRWKKLSFPPFCSTVLRWTRLHHDKRDNAQYCWALHYDPWLAGINQVEAKMKDLITVSDVLMCSISKSAKRHRASQRRSRLKLDPCCGFDWRL